ncbi:uncharacterized protein LOC143851963 [Tasmannia lanceolata]|uniref:uncharacterized protein LOC143851963 n=1 Tax=Tasmannia lanceolata TaxID=3420 RepID=UPI004062FC42
MLQTPIEALEMQNVEISPMAPSLSRQNDSNVLDDDDGSDWCEDGSSVDGIGIESDLLNEWERRHASFHTIGYRDGVTEGKQASAQEGFNVGFQQSVLVGYNWGLVRGVTSALAFLPDHLKEKLVPKLETREKLQNLYESVHSISKSDALKLLHDDILASGLEYPHNHSKESVAVATTSDVSGGNQLGKFSRELEHLILESPTLEVHTTLDRQMTT